MKQEFVINTEYIELIKLLKAIGVADTGGNAKEIVREGLIKVNGETELRLRCKLYDSYVVEIDNIKVTITKPKP